MADFDQPAAVGEWDAQPGDRFIAVFEDVWEALRGTPELSVYMGLKRRVMPDRPQVFGTRSRMAAECGVSVSTFQRSIRRLCDLGLVQVVHRYVPAGWKGDERQIARRRTDSHPLQIGNLYRVRFHLPKVSTPPGQSDPTPGSNRPDPRVNLTRPPGQFDPQIKNLGIKNLGRGARDAHEAASEGTAAGVQAAPSPSPAADESLDRQASRFVDAPAQARCEEHEGTIWTDRPCGRCAATKARAKDLAAGREAADEADRERRRRAISECELCDDNGFAPVPADAGYLSVVRCPHDARELLILTTSGGSEP